MKSFTQLFIFGFLTLLTIANTGCGKKGCTDKDALNYCDKCSKDDGTCTYKGKVVFWYDGAGYWVGTMWTLDKPVKVYVENQYIGDASDTYSTAPTCTAIGCALYTNVPGQYNWKTVGATGKIYTGVVEITSKGCTAVKAQ